MAPCRVFERLSSATLRIATVASEQIEFRPHKASVREKAKLVYSRDTNSDSFRSCHKSPDRARLATSTVSQRLHHLECCRVPRTYKRIARVNILARRRLEQARPSETGYENQAREHLVVRQLHNTDQSNQWLASSDKQWLKVDQSSTWNPQEAGGY